MKLNKRGTDKIISVYWFAILFIVAGGIVYMAGVFYGEPYDIRDIEANFLTNKVADCLSEGGRLVESWDKINSENFLQRCNLNFNVEDFKGWKNDKYYVNVSYREFNNNKWSDSFIGGNFNLEQSCNKGKNNPLCVERSFYTLDEGNIQYVIKIKSVVRKTEKNVQ